MKNKSSGLRILGIDLGSNSVGWAMINQSKSNPSILGVGVRVFEAGLDSLEQDGRGKSRNLERREARSRRRMTERTSRRLRKLAFLLQKSGLLPDGNIKDSGQRQLLFTELDLQLGSPYLIRAKALEEKLDKFEIGRVFYHLAQRRGFLSNRKSAPKQEDEEKGIKGEISELADSIKKTDCRTLGEYFSKLNPKESRIRTRYTSRKMYMEEFHAIWESQKRFYPELLTDEIKKMIYHAVFYQRPLKSQKGLVGKCELETGCRRAAWGLIVSQRFRYLQSINNLRIQESSKFTDRSLSKEERKLLIEALEYAGDQTFPKIRKLLGLNKFDKFNLELGGEKKIPGNRTVASIIKIIGMDKWLSLSEDRRVALVDDFRCIEKDSTLKNRLMEFWALSEEEAQNAAEIRLESGYCNFSQRALKRLLPYLMEDFPLPSAIKECYPERFERIDLDMNNLPPVKSDFLPELRNPIVERSLTELRKTINAIIREYGKPDYIRIELARDLRQSATQRQNKWKKMRLNERDRENAAQKIMEETSISNPTATDILKVQLASECNWECPYTGRAISITSLVGDHPQFDIEHIIPFDRCLDNSYVNKTLCWAEENRNTKHKRTPFEAYHNIDKWDDIISRVENFKGDMARIKLRRFLMPPKEVDGLLSEFTNRQLNDTRWASKWAKRYLGLLFGGTNSDGIDSSGKRRVMATSGQITAFLRNEWGLNKILSDGPGKTRDDHRHHAVDAIAVALTDQATIKILSQASQRSISYTHRLFKSVPQPWDGFFAEVEGKIKDVIVSHSVSKKVRGPLHKETLYGKPRTDSNGKTYVHIRTRVDNLSIKDIENIIDPTIRYAVLSKLQELDIDDPKKAFASPENHPVITGGDGRIIPIHKVRIRDNRQTTPIGGLNSIRYVQTASNHHMEIVEIKFPKSDRVKWEGHVVTLMEAYQRKLNGQPIIQREFGDNRAFKFSLSNGEVIELDTPNGKKKLYVVRSIEKDTSNIRFVPINDARPLKNIGKKGFTALPEPLRKKNCRKICITPLGQIRDAND
nr:type II CRISPR RNA-guided endonuclease Cas9 [candidate division Zixibacteria bacterium]